MAAPGRESAAGALLVQVGRLCLQVLCPPAEDVAGGKEQVLLDPTQLEACVVQFEEVLKGSVERSTERIERS